MGKLNTTEKRINSTLDYFELLLLEKLTYGEGPSAFKAAGGKEKLSKVLKNVEAKSFDMDAKNYQIVAMFREDVFESIDSMSKETLERLTDIKWIGDLVNDLNDEEYANDTIVAYSSFGTYNDVLSEYEVTLTPANKRMNLAITKIQDLIKKGRK